MFKWLRKLIGSECEIDHEYYYDMERINKRKVSELGDIIELKDVTITELKSLNTVLEKKINYQYDNRTP